jgi:hypothetical protein
MKEGDEMAEVRCSLCGRPAPALPPQVKTSPPKPDPSRKAAPVYICDLCAHKARYEAQETGHGLTGKEERPI